MNICPCSIPFSHQSTHSIQAEIVSCTFNQSPSFSVVASETFIKLIIALETFTALECSGPLYKEFLNHGWSLQQATKEKAHLMQCYVSCDAQLIVWPMLFSILITILTQTGHCVCRKE